jgi:two-component system chemotaxis response regulator CheY
MAEDTPSGTLRAGACGMEVPERAQAARRKILIVDDDDGIRETFRDLLRFEGYEVETAENGHAALQRVEAEPPGMVLLDMIMPVMDGMQFLRILRQHADPEVARVAVAVISGIGPAGEQLRAHYACELLAKPVDARTLLCVVRRHCG